MATTTYRSYTIEVMESVGRPTARVKFPKGEDRTVQAETREDALAMCRQFIDFHLLTRSHRYEPT